MHNYGEASDRDINRQILSRRLGPMLDNGIPGSTLQLEHAATSTTGDTSTIHTLPEVAAPKSVPRLSTMFTGRNDILERLAQYLNPYISSVSLSKQRIFVLHGLGGTGKTQIMAKFVNEFGDQYDHDPFQPTWSDILTI